MNSREDVLQLLNGRWIRRTPCFTGLTGVVEAGLESIGVRFYETHTDPAKMAAAAATTHRLFGWESATVPLDMGVEAGALGAEVDFRADSRTPQFPIVARKLAGSISELALEVPGDLTQRGRIPVVVEAIRLLKEDVGRDVVVGAWVPGPFTLATQIVELNEMMASVATEPGAVGRLLDQLTDVLANVALAYHAAGSDFITIHEMGGSPGVIGPRAFQNLVLPRLQRLIAAIPGPRVLSACGRTDRFMPLLAECGAEALSVDQANDLAKSRAALGPKVLLFGNLDPIGTLVNGDEAAVRQAVRRATDAGADAIWPGCDLWPPVPAANLRTMVEEARSTFRLTKAW